jgi:hypothetical protein
VKSDYELISKPAFKERARCEDVFRDSKSAAFAIQNGRNIKVWNDCDMQQKRKLIFSSQGMTFAGFSSGLSMNTETIKDLRFIKERLITDFRLRNELDIKEYAIIIQSLSRDYKNNGDAMIICWPKIHEKLNDSLDVQITMFVTGYSKLPFERNNRIMQSLGTHILSMDLERFDWIGIVGVTYGMARSHANHEVMTRVADHLINFDLSRITNYGIANLIYAFSKFLGEHPIMIKLAGHVLKRTDLNDYTIVGITQLKKGFSNFVSNHRSIKELKKRLNDYNI